MSLNNYLQNKQLQKHRRLEIKIFLLKPFQYPKVFENLHRILRLVKGLNNLQKSHYLQIQKKLEYL